MYVDLKPPLPAALVPSLRRLAPAPEETMTFDSAAAPVPRRRATPAAVRRRRRFPTPNTHERLHAATAAAVAEAGLERVTVESICLEAGVSAETFRSHFATPEEAALSAVESGADAMMSSCRAAFRAAPDWPEAVWAAFAVFLDCTACEPAFARLAIVEMRAAGPAGLELLRSLMDAFAIFLAPGYRRWTHTAVEPGSLDETVTADVLALLQDHILHASAETLPTILPDVVRTILTPFLGEEEAERAVARQLAQDRGLSR